MNCSARPFGESLYLRLSNRPIDQVPFDAALARDGRDQLRSDVLAGGYRLISPDQPADVIVAASGAVMPEAVASVAELAAEGVRAALIDVTNLGACTEVGYRLNATR
jgi:pyruvate dehydrogenase E1 component